METKTEVLEMPVEVNSDISDILKEASLSWLHPFEAYHLGVIDGRSQVISDDQASVMRSMIPYAEIFYEQLKRVLPEGAIRQHRIGIDDETGIPTSLTVIASSYEKDLINIMHIARKIELALFKRYTTNCHFWTITDEHLDQELIESDFPYYRSDIDVDK